MLVTADLIRCTAVQRKAISDQTFEKRCANGAGASDDCRLENIQRIGNSLQSSSHKHEASKRLSRLR
jgi:hypothetical protein